MEQDPAGYVDGANLYQLEESSPASRNDPGGTDTTFWRFMRCWQDCLDNNDPAEMLARYVLEAWASGHLAPKLAKLLPYDVLGANKAKLADFAEKVLGDAELAKKIRSWGMRMGTDELGDLRRFLRPR